MQLLLIWILVNLKDKVSNPRPQYTLPVYVYKGDRMLTGNTPFTTGDNRAHSSHWSIAILISP